MQHKTDLVGTIEAHLANNRSVDATAETLFTHRHTIRPSYQIILDRGALGLLFLIRTQQPTNAANRAANSESMPKKMFTMLYSGQVAREH